MTIAIITLMLTTAHPSRAREHALAPLAALHGTLWLGRWH